MKDNRTFPEHEDLEDRIYISTDIQFETAGVTYDGLNPMEVEEIKGKKKLDNIENIDHARNRRSNTRELF
jgi:hypothetical protein